MWGNAGLQRPSLTPILVLLQAWSLLLLLCLFSSSALAQQQNTTNTPVTTTTSNATDAKGLEGAALAAAIDENSEAQEFKEETIPVSAQVIKGEKAAVLNAGTGDVSTTGVCRHHAADASVCA